MLTKLQRGGLDRPESRVRAHSRSKFFFNIQIQSGTPLLIQYLPQNYSDLDPTIVNRGSTINEGDRLALEPNHKGSLLQRQKGRLGEARELALRRPTLRPSLYRVTLDDGLEAVQFRDGNNGALDPKVRIFRSQIGSKAFQLHFDHDVVEIFIQLDGLNDTRLDPTIKQLGFPGLNTGSILKSDFDFRPEGFPLLPEKPTRDHGG